MPKAGTLSAVDRLVLGLFVRRDALASSRMEGTWSTIDHVLTPGELFDKKEKSARATVLGYANALDAVYDKALQKGLAIFDESLIKKLHYAIMIHDPEYSGKPGVLRNEEKPPKYVTIGGLPRVENSTYNPVPPGHLKSSLNQVLEWMRDDVLVDLGNAGQGMGLVIRMAVAHAHFEAVHPFRDGNGRVGRMLLTLQMVSEGHAPLYLSNYIEMQKNKYYAGLAKAQKKMDYAPLIDFFSDAVIASWEESAVTKQALLQLPTEWEKRGAFRGKSAASRFLPHLISHPIFTVKNLSEILKVSAPAASNAVQQLSEAGIIRERTGFDRNRVFAAEEVIALLARPMNVDVEEALAEARALMGE